MALTRYDVFLRVVSYKSFSRAAEELGYTQSAVSQAINQMEKEMGFKLIERGRNNLRLTAEGEELFPYIERASESERIIERKVEEMKRREYGIVTIGASQHVSCVLKPEIMKIFRNEHPEIRISIINENPEQLKNMLDVGTLDFCIKEVREEKEGQSVILVRDRYKVVLPMDHEYANEEFIKLDKLGSICDDLKEGKEVLVFEEDCRGDEQFRSFSTNDTGIFLSMVENGFGIGMISESALEKYNYDILIKDTDIPVYRNLGIVVSNNSKMSASARAFVDYLLDYFKR